ncbi:MULTISPECIES: hypothetical protein [unclassified Bradyrhizobium]|uniref:hypothetical protein n=1 Tax=unclassified Bradyrhizobium TaxID=2631580 RepID=UPI0028E87E69|nr:MULTISPECIES: hypothetical protein [unclassified Bradyrhizobium]
MKCGAFRSAISLLAVVSSTAISGCASFVPYFDIPVDQKGAPTVQSIVRRVTCELAGLLDDNYGLRNALLISDIQVSLQLNLTVNDTGGLSPSVSFISGPFAFGLGGTLSQSREQNYTEKLYYSLRDLQQEIDLARKNHLDLAACQPINTNLAGELGLRRTVELAFTSPHLDWTAKLSDGAFGGYVKFVVTKNVNAGPTWTLTQFTGPGSNLGTFSEVNTDNLTFAFARGDKVGTPFRVSGRAKADYLIQQMNINQISTALSKALR